MPERIDRRAYKARARELLETAQVSPRRMTALWLGLKAVLSLFNYFGNGTNLIYVFLVVLTLMLSVALDAGFALYCMAIRRGERAEYLTLFDGFSVAGKVILLMLVEWLFIALWSMLFVIPGIIALYRYRFALYNLLENPQLGVMDALSMSKRQTYGFKGQILLLDMSYLGWAILASLPDMLYRSNIQVQVQGIVGASAYWNIQDVFSYVNPDVFGIPWIAWEALMTVWALVVSIYYRAHYQCVELAYFDTAKRASGVGYMDDGGEYRPPYGDNGEPYQNAYGGEYQSPYGDNGGGYQSPYGGDNAGSYGNGNAGSYGGDNAGSYSGDNGGSYSGDNDGSYSGGYDGNDRNDNYGGEP